MAIITFKSNGNKETGNTASLIAVATYMSIKHNIKTLLLSTSLNDDTIQQSFWTESKKNKILPNSTNNQMNSIQSGIEGLSRMINSSKIEPRLVRDYTKVVLMGRLDVLSGCTGTEEQYIETQKSYAKLISVANQYYDMVLVDLDNKLNATMQEQILQISDIIVYTTCQKLKDIQLLNQKINDNNIVAIGKYDDDLKYNMKNISRTLLKNTKRLNTIPYNGRFYESLQEGTVIDLFLNMLRIKNQRDPNYIFLQEVENSVKNINETLKEVRTKKDN